MRNPRKHGKPPFTVAVLHGGPGAAGETAPVARELASCRGVLEPIQTEASLEGQVEELRALLERHADLPVTLIGFSWGAWLGFISASRHPHLVSKLILVGSGPFEEEYALGIMETRLSRLDEKERKEAEDLIRALDNPDASNDDAAMERLGTLIEKADAYDPIPHEAEPVECRADIYQCVWKEAAELRRSGNLLELSTGIRCPVVAIHGDHDPHPAKGVEKPLSALLNGFRFLLLDKCGHKPWIEREAEKEFFRIINEELS